MDKYRKHFFLGGALTVFLLLSLLVTINFIKKNQTLGSSAAGTTFSYYGTSLNTYGLFGQKVVGASMRNKVSGATQEHAPGVVIDKSSVPNKVYVVDSGDSRILGYSGIGACSNNTAVSCTTDSDCGTGNQCNVPAQFINKKQADIVIGQSNFTSGACNGDDNLGWNKAPTASTLCLIEYPYGNNSAEQWTADNVDVDSQGNLYITDIYNNRVLEYYQPFSTDKTGGKGDSIADAVWGQPDFTHNGRNRSAVTAVGTTTPLTPPAANTLWLGGVGCFGAGNPSVSVDPTGNLWVADTCNHRILRFPSNSQSADIVIGQTDFAASFCNQTDQTSLNQLCGTMQARVNPDTGDLYVLDRNVKQAFQSRILVFHSPFTNGMSAYKIVIPQAPNYVDWGSYDGNGTYLFQGSGFTFNPDKVDYPNGVLWVTEHDGFRVLLIDGSGNVIKTINAVDDAHRGGNIPAGCPYYYNNGNGTGYGLNWPSSAVSFDSANNIYITAEEYSTASHIVRFALPYDTFVNSSGTTCIPLPNGGINWIAPLSNDTISGGDGLLLYQNQLVSLHDDGYESVYGGAFNGKRIMAWNNFQALGVGPTADFSATSTQITNVVHSSAVDDQGRWWAINNDLQLIVYQLPINTSSPTPVVNNRFGANPFYWADDGTQITNLHLYGFTFDPINKVMYAIDNGSRILRINNYNQFTGKLNVDEVIGQTNKTNTFCNQGLSGPNAGTLCQVREVKFDKLGNLYAVDDNYECHGNRRITMFAAADLKNATGMFPGLQAQKVFNEPDFASTNNCSYWVTNAPGTPVNIAFDSMNHMVVGNDGYYGQPDDQERQLKQLWFYGDPVNKQTPDASINIYMGTPGDMTFDASDNLVFQDNTWNRMQMINLCTDPQLLSYLPGVNPVNTCSTPVVTPTPTPVVTPTPTALPTPLSSPSPTPKPNISVIITAPSNGATVTRSTTVTITASVTSTNPIAKVTFAVNGTVTCTDTTSPYTCNWKVPGAKGKIYTITAQAFDNLNNSSSTSISVVAK